MSSGPVQVLAQVALVLVAAKLGAEAARRARLPTVVGEIAAGLVIGATGFRLLPSLPAGTEAASHDAIILDFLGQFGVLLLLFEVGLESDLAQFRRVGASAGLVGFLGVALSLLVGAATSWTLAAFGPWAPPGGGAVTPLLFDAFTGAVLTATSVGITARVLSEMGRIRSREAQVILGAAVADDVLGLVVLAILGGIVTSGHVSSVGVLGVAGKSIGFFLVALVVASVSFPPIMRRLEKWFRLAYVQFGFGVLLMFVMSYLATLFGLAPIVGAFVAGIALNASEHRHAIFDQLRPMASLFAGFFFVLLGARVDLRAFPWEGAAFALLAVAALSVSGALAKLGAGLGVLRGQADRLAVGVGMIPRGEVGFIFALAALQLGVVENWEYSVLILVILVTTLVTPPWLKRLAGRFQPTVEEPAQARTQATLR